MRAGRDGRVGYARGVRAAPGLARTVPEMDAAGNDFRLELYGQAHHAFDNPEAGTDPSARLVYSPAAADRSRRAIASLAPFDAAHRVSLRDGACFGGWGGESAARLEMRTRAPSRARARRSNCLG